jgi:hypothetical protein
MTTTAGDNGELAFAMPPGTYWVRANDESCRGEFDEIHLAIEPGERLQGIVLAMQPTFFVSACNYF